MNKKTKWGIIAFIGIGLIGMAVNAFLPHKNKELAEVPTKASTSSRNRTLNVIAEVIKESTISDASEITGILLPDEEVNLSFETSGKITAIHFYGAGCTPQKSEIVKTAISFHFPQMYLANLKRIHICFNFKI